MWNLAGTRIRLLLKGVREFLYFSVVVSVVPARGSRVADFSCLCPSANGGRVDVKDRSDLAWSQQRVADVGAVVVVMCVVHSLVTVWVCRRG